MRYLWYSMYAFASTLALYALFFAPGRRTVPVHHEPPLAVGTPAAVRGDVEIALLLDTSSSMDGLIEQARTQLWEIVAELQSDDQDQQRTVTVALYQYGNSRLDSATGFIERLSPLTPELDLVSVKLHGLTTSGGKEFAPQAIQRAVEELAWSDEDSVEKIIVVAGNEGFGQGPVTAQEATAAAAARGIRVIPIFCANGGATSTGLDSWKQAAQLAGTDLETIDPDQVVARIQTPYDAAIVSTYKQLEQTELTYGDVRFREEVASYRVSSNSYAQQKPMATQADRALAQARQTHQGDLIAECKAKRIDLGSLDQESLPAELQGLSKDQRVQAIEQRAARRSRIETELKELARKRDHYMQTAAPAAAAPTLGSSVRSQLRR
jgi:hypothetical protein